MTLGAKMRFYRIPLHVPSIPIGGECVFFRTDGSNTFVSLAKTALFEVLRPSSLQATTANVNIIESLNWILYIRSWNCAQTYVVNADMKKAIFSSFSISIKVFEKYAKKGFVYTSRIILQNRIFFFSNFFEPNVWTESWNFEQKL